MNAGHPVGQSTEILMRDCDVIRTRGSGPGGQHRNKVETAIVITHKPTGVKGEASEKRSQEENRLRALFRLRKNLALEVRSTSDINLDPITIKRIRNRKLSINVEHDDYPVVLTDVLDVLNASDFDLGKSSQILGISNSQILKFLKQWPPAFHKFNEQRQKMGLPRIRFG